MPTRKQIVALASGFTAFISLYSLVAMADDKRAPAPKFDTKSTQGIFFPSVSDAIQGDRPSLESLRQTKTTSVAVTPGATASGDSSGGDGPWDKLITATSIEDEVKRMKLHYDSVVTTPGPFKSGGYEDARLDLMVLSSLFAITSEYKGDIRWKEESAAARDLLARTAFNCNAGTTQVFNEAKTRKDDLQDLISGGGLRGRKAEEGNDWSSIADRAPLMNYIETLNDQLREASASKELVDNEPGDVRRPAEVLAAMARILIQEGMDDADDEDYRKYSQAMMNAALEVKRGVEVKDYDMVSRGVGGIMQSCDDCHGEYR
ncbi:cytochrome c [Rhodopirellula sp. MGV]|uniref:cytochrome c n=1 Tax=Rhodopirellula sp. MGV TaxID=2023130 RepID=UPI00117BDB31|nr:cytochrome c [Rhodopirellula sp. MGV]